MKKSLSTLVFKLYNLNKSTARKTQCETFSHLKWVSNQMEQAGMFLSHLKAGQLDRKLNGSPSSRDSE